MTTKAGGRPRSKYRNVRTEYNGVGYSSKAEAKRAAELDFLMAAGEIKFWIGQPTFRLGCALNVYKPDFLVVDPTGGVWCEDVKGVRTAKFARDVRLWRRYGPCPLHVISGRSLEVIEPGAPAGGGA
jgi:hypothetical protein